MRVLISYLPAVSEGRYTPISQQRFAKPRADSESIYPVILASGATLLDNSGFAVKYVDAVMKRLALEDFLRVVAEFQPELLVFETKTPVVKDHWMVVKTLKARAPGLKIAACGDHVTVLPEETMQNSPVDFVITGGDYDTGMLGVALHIRDGKELPAGIYYWENGAVRNNGTFQLIKDLDVLPFINRDLVPWHEYHEAWRLYPRFMYIMTARGCLYKCTFCSWAQMLYKGRFRTRSVGNVIDEIERLIQKYRAQELFIDSDTLTCPRSWIREFCENLLRRNTRIVWSCNGHVANVDFELLALMKHAGCRMIKFGVESASQNTLDRIRKNYSVGQIVEAFSLCKKAGLHAHATVMIGFYWETRQDILNTMDFVRALNPYEVQFSIPIAYPGTALYAQAKEKGWLRFPDGDWEKWDMAAPTMKNAELSAEEITGLYFSAWRKIYFRPRFILNRLLAIRSLRDIPLAARGLATLRKGHLRAPNPSADGV